MHPTRFALTALVAATLAAPASAAIYNIATDPLDYEPRNDNLTANGASNYLRVGVRTTGAAPAGTSVAAVFPFALPALAPGEVITSATITFYTAAQTSNLPVANADLYGMPFDTAPFDQLASRYYAGPLDTTAGTTLLQDNFLTPASVTNANNPYTTPDLTAYLPSLYTAGAVGGDFAVLRLSYDQTVDTTTNNRYQVISSAGASATPTPNNPVLTINTVIPEPATALTTAALTALTVANRRRRRA